MAVCRSTSVWNINYYSIFLVKFSLSRDMSAEKKLKIDRSGYALSFLEKFNKLRRDGTHCDFCMKVGEEVHRVHRNVLSISSEYFRAMLEQHTAESKQGFVELKDVDPVAVRKAVDFMYTAKVSVGEGHIAGLIHVAHMMQLEELCEGITEFLAENISTGSFYDIKHTADIYNLVGLQRTCKEYACRNFEAIVSLDNFAGLDEDFVLALIESPNTNAAEVLKYKAFTKWIAVDPPNRSSSFSRMLKALNTADLPPTFRRYIVDNEPMVYESADCLKTLLGSFFLNVPSKDVDVECDNAIAAFDPNSHSIKAYDVKEQTKLKICNVDREISSHSFSIATIDRHIYALRNDKKLFRFQYLNAASTWTEIATTLQHHGQYPPIVSYGGCLYTIGNSDRHDTASEIYDPAKNEWVQLTARGEFVPRFHYSLCAAKDSILLIGGGGRNANYGNSGNALQNCDKLNVCTLSWQAASPMSRPRQSAASAHLNGKVYVVGGQNQHNIENVAEIYNVKANSWTSIANLPSSMFPLGAAFVKNTLYVVGPSNIFEYDDANNTWKRKQNGDLISSMSTPGCFSVTI